MARGAPPAGGAARPIAPSRPALAGKAHAPWSEVLLLAGLSLFGSVAMDMYLPALPQMAAELHASPKTAQQTVSIFLFGLAAGQLIFGPLSDRFGRRAPLLAGVVLFLAASGLCAASSSGWMLVGARLLQALGACAGMVIARAVVRDRYDDHEVLHVFSLISLVFTVGPVLAPLIGGWVLGVADWRWIFALQAIFGLAVGLVAFLRLKETRSEETRLQAERENVAGAYAALLKQPLLVGYLAVAGFSAAAMFAYITAAPQIVMGELHIAPAHFGWVFGINAVGQIGCSQINARLARRIPADRILVCALLVALLAALTFLASVMTGVGGAAGILLPLFVMLSAMGFTNPNATAAAMSVDRSRAGATAALLGAGFFGVGSLAGVAMAPIPGPVSHGLAVVTVGSLVLALGFYAFLVRAQRLAGIPAREHEPAPPETETVA